MKRTSSAAASQRMARSQMQRRSAVSTADSVVPRQSAPAPAPAPRSTPTRPSGYGDGSSLRDPFREVGKASMPAPSTRPRATSTRYVATGGRQKTGNPSEGIPAMRRMLSEERQSRPSRPPAGRQLVDGQTRSTSASRMPLSEPRSEWERTWGTGKDR
jgi:hypothetical protein